MIKHPIQTQMEYSRLGTSKLEAVLDFSDLEDEKIRRMKTRIPYFLDRLNRHIPKGSHDQEQMLDQEVKEERGRVKTPASKNNVKRSTGENKVLAHYPPTKEPQNTKNMKEKDIEYEAELRQARLALKDRQRRCVFNNPASTMRPCPPLSPNPPAQTNEEKHVLFADGRPRKNAMMRQAKNSSWQSFSESGIKVKRMSAVDKSYERMLSLLFKNTRVKRAPSTPALSFASLDILVTDTSTQLQKITETTEKPTDDVSTDRINVRRSSPQSTDIIDRPIYMRNSRPLSTDNMNVRMSRPLSTDKMDRYIMRNSRPLSTDRTDMRNSTDKTDQRTSTVLSPDIKDMKILTDISPDKTDTMRNSRAVSKFRNTSSLVSKALATKSRQS